MQCVRSFQGKSSASAQGPHRLLVNYIIVTDIPAKTNIIANTFFIHSLESQSTKILRNIIIKKKRYLSNSNPKTLRIILLFYL